MRDTGHTKQEIARLGKERYERDIRSDVESHHKGELLALDIETGYYEIDSQAGPAVQRVKARHPDAVVFVLRIGYPTAYKLGAHVKGLRS
ncbi:MAG: hypothetical protein JXQ73_23485 [Phycisphaerae bacterium]|nr:hypothetical protein [Phycisphaerae bacterium]